MEKNKKAGSMILGVAFVWFTTHFGGGFASGAQIYSYYVRYGVWSLFMPFLAMAYNGVFFAYCLYFARKHQVYDYRSYNDAFYGKYAPVFSNLFEVLYLCVMCVAPAVAFATGGATLSTLTGLPYTNADELKSIQVGGIDFITKPYDTLILLEKIKRALQLSNPNNFRELVKKDCTLDLHLSILKYQEKSIELTRNEFRILYYFFMNEDKVISKEELLEKLWNDKYYLDENVLLVNMTRLKKKMKEIGIVHLLENIRGKGWKL